MLAREPVGASDDHQRFKFVSTDDPLSREILIGDIDAGLFQTSSNRAWSSSVSKIIQAPWWHRNPFGVDCRHSEWMAPGIKKQ